MKEKLIKLFFSTDALWTNILKIFSSSMITSLITIGLSPIVSRIYSTNAFGVYTIIFATASILSELITLKYERAILLPEKIEDAISLFWLSNLLSLFFSILLVIPIYFFESYLLNFHNLNDPILIYLIPFIAFVLASNVCVVNLITKLKYYNLITSNRIYISLLLNVMIISLGYLNFNGLGLVISYTLSNLFSSVLLILGIYNKHQLFNFKLKDLKYWFKRYIGFPKFFIPSIGLESGASNMPNFVYMNIIGSSFLGNFNMSNRIVNTPMGLIGNAIRTVFNQAIAEAYASKQTHIKIFMQNFYRLLIIAIFPILVIFTWGPQIFSIIFGTEWYDAGVIARYLSPVIFIRFISSPLSSILTIYEKLNIDFKIQIFTTITISISFYLLWKFGFKTYPMYLIIFNLIYGSKYILELYFSYKLIKDFENNLKKSNNELSNL